MKQNNPLVSINLITYNSKKYLDDCLRAVFGQSYSNIEVLVIDNASKDETIEYLKGLKKRKNLKIIFNKKNNGFTGGHNQGIRESNGEFILCLNPDVVLSHDFVKYAVKTIREDEKIGAVQGKLLRWNTGKPIYNNFEDQNVSKIIDTTGLAIFKNRRIINRGQGQIENRRYFNKKEEIFGADGAAPIYRREALEDVKIKNEYFDEDFFCYKEDVDLAWRLRLFEWKAVYQPKAVALHDRTSGESAVLNPFGVLRERIKINKFSKYYAFKNQRLMQIKNEHLINLILHSPWLVPKEIISWIYVILFERHTLKAIKDLFKQMPKAFRKRKIIMSKKKLTSCEMRELIK